MKQKIIVIGYVVALICFLLSVYFKQYDMQKIVRDFILISGGDLTLTCFYHVWYECKQDCEE